VDPGFVSDGSPDVESLRTAGPGQLVPAPHPNLRIPPRFWMRALGVPQALRLFGCFAAIAAIEAAQRPLDLLAGAASRAARRDARRTRAAQRVARALGDLKGPFAKAGQFASLRYDVLTPEVRAAFAALQDRVPPRPFAEVAALVEAELGAPLATRFSEFEQVPLGAASVAQVHRARLVSGEAVAVKVQFPWLAYSLPADLAIARLLLRALGGRRAAASRARLFDEFAAGIAEELDFAREARVAGEIAANLAGDPQVVVPVIHRTLSTRRVLVMGYLPAIPIADRATLERRGIPVRDVLATLARAYAKQVFVDGLFHADPHPGNLIVIDEADAAVRPRVLFIDFGLSKHLDPALRREMRLGIHALLRRDVEAFLDGMDRMGMIDPGARDAVRAAVAAMFERMAGEGQVLGLGGAQVLALKDQAKRLLEETPGLHLPNELLLYAKTMAYLFALGEQLAPDVDLMKLSVPYLLRFLAQRE
jgi:predicted unusual protein kinase regulating ubiquinone biosynthesis (AarF/ABC1/UbiB family)